MYIRKATIAACERLEASEHMLDEPIPARTKVVTSGAQVYLVEELPEQFM